MAIRRALSAGTWNPEAGTGTATWDAVPVDGDTVHANGFAITMSAGCIMANTHLRTTAGTATLGGAIAAGGSFTVTASTDITLASVLSGSTTCLVISAASFTSAISIADCRGSGTTANIPGLAISSTNSTFTFSNTSFFGGAATGTSYGASFTGSGTIAFTNCTATGGPGAATAYGVAITGTNAATGTLNLAQVSNSAAHALSYTSLSDSNLTGSVNHQNYGGTISYGATGLLTYTITSETITGTFTVGNGLFSAIGGIGTLTVVRPSGSLQLANATYGFTNNGTVSLTISGDLTCTHLGSALQLNIAGSGVLRHNGILTGPAAWATGDQVVTVNGGLVVLDRLARNPSSGFLPSFNGICIFKTTSTIVATTESGTVTLVDATTVGDPPSQANVRSGTTYQFGAMTGTCRVPGASSVAAGVLVDATTGTAVLTQAAVSSVLSTYETNGVASQNDLASVSVDLSGVIGYLTAITAAIGAFTGSGVNTVKGFLTALMSKTASTPSDIGGTFSPSTDSIESISEATSAVKSKTDSLTFTTPGKVDATAVLDSAAQAQIGAIQDNTGYLLALNAGAVSDPQSASSTYVITVGATTYTVALAGQTSTGVRTAPALSKA